MFKLREKIASNECSIFLSLYFPLSLPTSLCITHHWKIQIHPFVSVAAINQGTHSDHEPPNKARFVSFRKEEGSHDLQTRCAKRNSYHGVTKKIFSRNLNMLDSAVRNPRFKKKLDYIVRAVFPTAVLFCMFVLYVCFAVFFFCFFFSNLGFFYLLATLKFVSTSFVSTPTSPPA
jgi:hypothetical protein